MWQSAVPWSANGHSGMSLLHTSTLDQSKVTRCGDLHNAIGVAAECMEPPGTDQPHTNRRRPSTQWTVLWNSHLPRRRCEQLLPVTQQPNRIPWLWLLQCGRTKCKQPHDRHPNVQKQLPKLVFLRHRQHQHSFRMPNQQRLWNCFLSVRF